MINNVKYTTEVITPNMAKRYLKCNTDNRPVRKRTVDFLSREMRQGVWELTGEAIKFSNKGKLLDGQHRLLAIAASGESVPCTVVRGLKEKVFTVLDTGVNRSLKDTLAIEGEKNAAILQGALRLVGIRKYDFGWFYQFSHPELLSVFEDYPKIRESVALAAKERTPLIPTRIVAFCHFVFAEIDEDHADLFIKQLAQGVGLNQGDSILALRRRLENMKINSVKISPRELICLIFRVWNHTRKGEPRNKIHIPPTPAKDMLGWPPLV